MKSKFVLPLIKSSVGCLLALLLTHQLYAQSIPEDFSYLSLVDPSIQQDIRYHTFFNFVGVPIDGYEAPECILTNRAALALKRVQAKLLERNFSLKVYDCYRPKSGVAHFVRWAKAPEDQKTKQLFYPNEVKSQLFKRGYIARRSGHSRGSTVDLTIVSIEGVGSKLAKKYEANGNPCNQNPVGPHEVGVVDMGTRYDCLDPDSGTTFKGSVDVKAHREYLTELMASEGFKGYSKEWWHFTLADEPYKKTYFDFPVVAPDMEALLRESE